MVNLCLMASHGCPPGNGLVFVQEHSRVFKGCPPYFLSQGARHEINEMQSITLGSHQHEESWRPMSELNDRTHFSKIDSPIQWPALIDVQDNCPDSELFSYGIAEQCTKREKILKFLTSGSNEIENGGLDLSLLSDLMDLQSLTADVHQQPYSHLIYPNEKFDFPKPLVDFVGDMARNSKITVQPDGQVMFSGSGAEIRDMLSIVAEFYLSKTSTKQMKQSMLVPHFIWPRVIEAQVNVHSSMNVKNVVTPLKSPKRSKLKQSTKKKSCRKGNKERDLYQRNYFHACESLLSLMMDKKRNGKTAILSLKKSGPELPLLLTQFSAGIAGTGVAVLFSVVCKVACGRVPLCGTRLFSTGLGFGLVWLSWAVNKLRDTIVYNCKNANKVGFKDEEMLKTINKSLKDVYFRAATLVVVAALRLA
ncbi:uncharacterized protein LOC126686405 [Mercurialis annua]|uniref:uncharacterized protein LOC126686405 n=1 Tax=Mercurialis annua TaxID=3986 RepID=UPI0021603C55|nr:uncharacterized protein LOC126686405 [Mercurialis annua]